MASVVAAWPTVALGEVLRQDTTYVSELEPRLYPKLSVPWWGKGVVLDPPADGSLVRMTRHQLAKPGQVIVSEIWAKHGSIGIVPPEGAGALITSHFFLFDIDNTRLVREYMRYLIAANFLTDQIAAIARGTTGYASIRPQHFVSLTIPLPPLDEQRRIVARIEELAARIAEARGLKHYTAIESARFWKTLSRVARDTNWPERRLDEMVEFLDGRRIPLSETDRATRKGPYPYYGASGIIDYLDDYIFDEELLLLSEDGANLINRSTPIAFVAHGKYWVNNHAHVLRPLKEVADITFLAYALSDYDVSVFNFASAQAKLNQSNARKIAFPLPPLHEQRNIVAWLNRLHAKVDELSQLQSYTQAELNALLPSVLDKAFRGEL